MEHLLFLLLFIIVLVFLVKVSRIVWKIINIILLLLIIWYFRESIIFYLNQFANWIPDQTVRQFMQDWVHWLADKFGILQSQLSN